MNGVRIVGSNPPSPLDSNENYVNGHDISTSPHQSATKYTPPHFAKYTPPHFAAYTPPPPVTKYTPPPPVTKYTPPPHIAKYTPPPPITKYTPPPVSNYNPPSSNKYTSPPQSNNRYTPSPPQTVAIIKTATPQPINKVSPIVISVRIPENPNPNVKSPLHVKGNERAVMIPSTAVVLKKQESIPSPTAFPDQNNEKVSTAVIRTFTGDFSQKRISPRNDKSRTPPILMIPPPPAPPPPPVPQGPPMVSPKPNLNGGLNCKLIHSFLLWI